MSDVTARLVTVKMGFDEFWYYLSLEGDVLKALSASQRTAVVQAMRTRRMDEIRRPPPNQSEPPDIEWRDGALIVHLAPHFRPLGRRDKLQLLQAVLQVANQALQPYGASEFVPPRYYT